MRNESISEFINCSRSTFKRQDKGAAPNRGAASKEAPRPKGGGSKQESKQGPDPVVGSGLSGSAQVTVIGHDKSRPITEAGVSPHAPHSPRRGRPRKEEPKKSYFKLRLSDRVKRLLFAKAQAEGFQAATTYVLGLIIDDLELPPDELSIVRNIGLKKAHDKNSIALDRVGNLLNQLTEAAHTYKPCPLTREQLASMREDHAAACKAHLKTGMVNDY